MALVVIDHVYFGWICSCDRQPPGIASEILRVRYEWDYAGIVIEENLALV
jgi:hypothetical protein